MSPIRAWSSISAWSSIGSSPSASCRGCHDRRVRSTVGPAPVGGGARGSLGVSSAPRGILLHPFLDLTRPLALAHRGAHGPHGPPENSLAAFAAAVELGFEAIETDLHATADGVLVAIHDPTLDRVAGRDGVIADMTWDEIRQVPLAGGHRVPRVEEILDLDPRLRVNLDVKADSAVSPLVDLLRSDGLLERICVGSFSGARLSTLRRAIGPELCTSAGPSEVLRWLLAAWSPSSLMSAALVPVAPACLQVPPRRSGLPVVTRRLVEATDVAGVPVHVWTIDDPDEMHRLLDLGVQGIVTDAPRTLREVLRERGQWPAGA